LDKIDSVCAPKLSNFARPVNDFFELFFAAIVRWAEGFRLNGFMGRFVKGNIGVVVRKLKGNFPLRKGREKEGLAADYAGFRRFLERKGAEENWRLEKNWERQTKGCGGKGGFCGAGLRRKGLSGKPLTLAGGRIRVRSERDFFCERKGGEC
jgi:hypothetical protein